MNNIPRVVGPGSPGEPNGSSQTDPTKFKQLMRVGDTDTDQQKKKKQNRESTEEMKAEQAVNQAPPPPRAPENLTHFQKSNRIEKTSKSTALPTPALHPEAGHAKNIALNKTDERFADAREKQKQEDSSRNQATKEHKSTPPQTPVEQSKTEPSPNIVPPQFESIGPFFIPAPSAAASGFGHMSPELATMLEKLINTIMVLDESGITETEITLSQTEFSTFANSKLLIREYSTAPKAFNIELQGTPDAIALFDANVSKMMAAFQQGQYRFKINRMEASLLDIKKSIVQRKKGVAEDKDHTS